MLQQSFSHKLVGTVLNFRWQRVAGRETAVSIPQAVQLAYQQIQQTHSEWVGNLFDKSFLTTEAAPLFAGKTLPTATQLGIAWCNQFGTSTEANFFCRVETVAICFSLSVPHHALIRQYLLGGTLVCLPKKRPTLKKYCR
jgi:hypothetical protein